MKKLLVTAAIVAALVPSPASAQQETAKWETQAKGITIVRDTWGIAHVYGKTDADAVFGMIYAQAEDDFNRVETNFINSQGRLAEAEGEAQIYRDLRMKMFIDPDTMKALYAKSPTWLKSLMNGWADGLNFYLYKHPNVTPRVIKHFEPWMALTFSEGSIGGDIEGINLPGIASFYGKTPVVPDPADDYPKEPGGSNGMAISPTNTVNHHALLLINPHTSFFFRSELQMTSDEGLNAYGAATWGQFFLYQGFNANQGWMHTTSSVDDSDDYLETVTKKGDHYVYLYDGNERPVMEQKIAVPFKSATGMDKKEFTVYRTHHGPIVRELNGRWVAVKIMNTPMQALIQSYSRTKTKNYAEFKKIMDDEHANSSNNTIYANKDGDIAYFHSNFIPRRDTSFNWRQPVDGSTSKTEWNGLLSVDESPHLRNPASGWLYNSNNSPWTAAGPSSPKITDYPKYVDNGSESFRSQHAVLVLSNKKDFTIPGLMGAAYDTYLTAFAEQIPPLLKAYDGLDAADPLKAKVADQIKMLRDWDYRWSVSSIPTSLAIYWSMSNRGGGGGRRGGAATPPSAQQMVEALSTASDKLTTDFGTWKTPWGDINRFQRLTDDIVHPFSDAGPSIPVGFPSATYGSLASFGARTYPGTKKMYGTSGNSFVAVVEFGDSVHAKAVTAGGESGDTKSVHFDDQATRYATGSLRDVYFYKGDVMAHKEREYHPGQ